MKSLFSFIFRNILVIMLFIVVHQAFSKAYSPKSLNSIPDRLIGIIKTNNAQATQEYMFSDGPNTDVIRLTYPDNKTFLGYYLFDNNDSYQLEVIDISTGKKELFYKTTLQNAGLPLSIAKVLCK